MEKYWYPMNELNMENIQKEQGYTLVEALFVLFILAILTAAVPSLYLNLSKNIEATHFLQTFEEDLYLAQQYALSQKVTVRYKYHYEKKQYEILASDQSLKITRDIPKRVEIVRDYLNEFRFKPNGNVSHFGNIYIKIDDQLYRMFFSIGRGRFELYKEEPHY